MQRWSQYGEQQNLAVHATGRVGTRWRVRRSRGMVASSVVDPGTRAQLVVGEVARDPGGKGSAVVRTPTYRSGSALGVGWLRRCRRRVGLGVL